MTKTKLVQLLTARTHVPRQTAEHAVNILFDSMRQALIQQRRIEIRGLGSFKVRQYGGYEGLNPKTQERVTVEPKVLPHFKMGKDISERLNSRRRRG